MIVWTREHSQYADQFKEMNVSAAISDAIDKEFDLEAVSVTRVLVESLNDSFWMDIE